jgi:hypothetical protein
VRGVVVVVWMVAAVVVVFFLGGGSVDMVRSLLMNCFGGFVGDAYDWWRFGYGVSYVFTLRV